MKIVEGWCLRRKGWFGPHKFLYFRLQPDGSHDTTHNIQYALRWNTPQEALHAGTSFGLSRRWHVHHIEILGNETIGRSDKIDDLLLRARVVFVWADYHPFYGIETEIYDAVNSGDYAQKMEVLRRLPTMLDRSDLESSHQLANEIRSYL